MGESNGLDTPAMQPFRLGALHRPAPAAVPMLRAQLAPNAPAIPRECRWDERVDWTGFDNQPDALGNDHAGCCVWAAWWRQCQLWRRVAGGDQRKPTQGQVLADYAARTGYDPARPETDRGTYTDEAYSWLTGHVTPWAEQMPIVPRWTVIEADGIAPNLQHLRAAIYALGGVQAIFRMPQSALENTEVWNAPPPGTNAARDMGAHAVLLAGYDLMGDFYGISWGRVIAIRPSFLVSRLMQASAFASDAWIDAVTGRTPSGLDRDQIRAIGAQIEGV